MLTTVADRGKNGFGKEIYLSFFSSLYHHSYSNTGLGGRIKPLIREAVTKQKKADASISVK